MHQIQVQSLNCNILYNYKIQLLFSMLGPKLFFIICIFERLIVVSSPEILYLIVFGKIKP